MKAHLLILLLFFSSAFGYSQKNNDFPYTIDPIELNTKECLCKHGNLKALYSSNLSLKFSCQCSSLSFKGDTLFLPDCYLDGNVKTDSYIVMNLLPSITAEQENKITDFKETLLKSIPSSDSLSTFLAQDIEYLVKSMTENNQQKYRAVLSAFEEHLSVAKKP